MLNPLLFIVIIGLFIVLKIGTERFSKISSYISKSALSAVFLAILFYIGFALADIVKLSNEVQSNTETIVESLNDRLELSNDEVYKITIALNDSLLTTYEEIEESILKNVKLSEQEMETLEKTLELRKEFDKDSKEITKNIVSFFVNLATMLGLYHILEENRKKNQLKIEEEKREIVKLKTTIRLLQEDLNTKKQQKFYEGYYEN